MRTIKFRAFSKRTKEMLMDIQNMYDGLGDWFDNNGNEIDPYKGFETSSFGGNLENEDVVVMQFTGLHDKNGKEIYEGDIIFMDDIEWWDESGRNGTTIIIDDITRLPTQKGDWSIDEESYVIIGNIHQNPELIK